MRIRTLLFALLATACASQQQSDGPPVTVKLEQLNMATNALYEAGPINLQYEVTVENATDHEVTLTRLEMHTEGIGAYTLGTNGYPMSAKIAPKSSGTFKLSAWGTVAGGSMSANEPVTIYATAYFESPSGSFVKQFHQNVWQP